VQPLGDRNGSAALFLDIDQASATGGARRLWVIFDRGVGLYLPFGVRSAPNATGAEARLTGARRDCACFDGSETAHRSHA